MSLGIAGIQARMAAIQAQFAPPGGFAQALSQAVSSPGATASDTGMLPASAAGSDAAVAASVPLGGIGATSGPRSIDSALATPTMPQSPVGSGQPWTQRLPEAARPWIGAIEAAAKRHGVDPKLLASLVKHESGFRQEARSHAGAIGLAQLMPGTARALGVDPHDPLQNLDGAARFLREMLDRFGSPDLALAAYNAGPGRVARAGGVPQITETQRYVRNVMSYYQQLR